jgi:cell division protein FtsI (penicillin-binding protein 3)
MTYKQRAITVSLGFFGIGLAVIFKVYQIQREGRKHFLTNEGDQTIPSRLVERKPRQGDILDINLVPLVTTVSYYDIHMDPTVVKQEIFDAEVSNLAEGLAKFFPQGRTAIQWENLIRTARASGNRYLNIAKKLKNSQRQKLRELPIFNLGRMKGGIIDTDESVERDKPNGNLLERTLGYYKLDEKTKKELRVGIEGAFYDYLRGENGLEVEQKFSTGWKKIGQIVKEPVEGASLVTSIDKEIQEVAHSELENQLNVMKADHGCVVVMDVKTGFIKAISNLGRNKKGELTESYNYAVGELETPGSTFKLAALMAGLEDRKFKITDSVGAYGKYVFPGGAKMQDANEGRGYGRITIQQAFEKSSNVIAQIIHKAYRKDPANYIKRLDKFGLTKPLQLDIIGEPNPVFYRPGMRQWSGTSLPWTSIGYELQMTPLQVLAFYNAVANNGQFLKPQFVKEIRRGGRIIKVYPKTVLYNNIASKETIEIMKRCLEGVMTNGTGKDLTSSQFTIAGKTGTAKLRNDAGTFGDKNTSAYQASFVGYFPANDPIYSCIVVISKPKVEYYGARVSGTVFAAIANKVYASRLAYHEAVNQSKKKSAELPIIKTGHKRDITYVLNHLGIAYQLNSGNNWVKSDTIRGKILLDKKEFKKDLVPSVIGMTARDAVFLLEEKGLKVKMSGYGKVVSQSREAGTAFAKGELIKIELAP